MGLNPDQNQCARPLSHHFPQGLLLAGQHQGDGNRKQELLFPSSPAPARVPGSGQEGRNSAILPFRAQEVNAGSL